MLVDLTQPRPHFRRNRYPGDIRLRLIVHKQMVHNRVVRMLGGLQDLAPAKQTRVLPGFLKVLPGGPPTLKTAVYWLDAPTAEDSVWYQVTYLLKVQDQWVKQSLYLGLTPTEVSLHPIVGGKEWHFAAPVGHAKAVWDHLDDDFLS